MHRLIPAIRMSAPRLAKQRHCAQPPLRGMTPCPPHLIETLGRLMTRSAVFAPVELIDGDRGKGIVLLADHARRDLPEEYGDLGLPPTEFDRHIAYDIGVEDGDSRARRAAWRAGRVRALLAPSDRSQPGRGRPDADSPALRRHRRAGELSDHRSRSASGGSTVITGPIMTRCRRSSPRWRMRAARRR